jgi:hypothetical protein
MRDARDVPLKAFRGLRREIETPPSVTPEWPAAPSVTLP